MADRSDRSDGESGNEGAHPRCGLSSAPPRLRAGGSSTMIPPVRWAVSHVTVPPQLGAPGAESGGTTSANARVAWFRAEAGGRAARRGLSACSRLSRGSIPPGEALAAARALLCHPPLRAGAGTPEGEWLDELAGLVRKAAPGPKAQNSSTTHGEPMAQPQRSATYIGGTPDLWSHLNTVRASEDASTALERARERRHKATNEHTSSGVPTGNDTTSDNDIGPYGAGCWAFMADLRRVDWPTKFRPDLPKKYDGTIDPEEFL